MDAAAMHWPRWRPRRTREHRAVSQRALLVWGWVAVALLFGLYVAVLHHAVQRAERVRSEQLSAGIKPPPHAGHYASISPRAGKP